MEALKKEHHIILSRIQCEIDWHSDQGNAEAVEALIVIRSYIEELLESNTD